MAIKPDPTKMGAEAEAGLVPSGRLPAILLAIVLGALAVTLAHVPPPPGTMQAAITPSTPWREPAATMALERIGFGSCLHQAKPQPILKSVLAKGPQLFLMMGDNVYGDVTNASLPELRTAYAQQAASAELAALRSRVPVLSTWDDHDYGRNDAGADFVWKAESRRLFAAFWQLREDALPEGGVYRSRVYGPTGRRVQIILLDTRSFRSPLQSRPAAEIAADRSKGRYVPYTASGQDMLGAAQWAWLEAELRKPAEIRLLVSSIQVLAESHGFEKWGNLPAERQRLYDVIGRSGAKGLVMLSGDRHRAGIYRKPDGRPFAVPEITSSALNMPFPATDPDEPARIGPMYSAENFGMLAIDWVGRRLAATLHDVDGREVARLDLAFADLGL